MRLRIAVGCGIAVLLGATVIATTALRTRPNQSSKQTENARIPIIVNQLSSDNGVIPVELQCTTSTPTTLNDDPKLTCDIKNNTTKPISAISIAYSIIFQRNGVEFSDSGFLTRDALIHPDFYESSAQKFIPPSGRQIITRGEAIQHEDASPKRIEANIDYVEFEDKTSLGPNVKGSNLITLIREGAAKYKEWLKQKYMESNESTDSIAPLLQDTSSLPEELKLNDTMLAVGAEAYRKNARDLYRRGGKAELEKLVKDRSLKQQY